MKWQSKSRMTSPVPVLASEMGTETGPSRAYARITARVLANVHIEFGSESERLDSE